MYLHAFAAGLNTLLDDYRSLISKMEQEALESEGKIPLTRMQAFLEEWFLIFPVLVEVVAKMEGQKLKGGQILGLVYQELTECGIPCLQSALECLFISCNRVWYDQLTSWMVYGLVTDPYHEFFIAREGTSESYGLLADRVPVFISLQVADSVFFVGDSVRLLSFNSKGGAPILSSGDVLTFVAALRSLASLPVFNIKLFENVIGKMRAIVAAHLRNRVVVEGQLARHLHALRDYLLMAKGDFWQAFITESRSLLSLAPKINAEHDLNILFQQAAGKNSLDGEDLFNKCVLKLNKAAVTDPPFTGGWNIRLQYKLEWPVDSFLKREDLDKYNQIFRFMFHLKRIQLELQCAWAHLQRKQLNKKERAELMTSWILRKNMSLLLDNLSFYFQVDVIEPEFLALVTCINESVDFAEIKQKHLSFVSTVEQGLFLTTVPVSRSLGDIFQLCFEFTNLTLHSSNSDPTKLAHLNQEFDRQSALLFALLSGLKNARGSSPQLRNLLLLMDYNNHFTKVSQ
eukprot:TRINITY_DN6661_c0_g1_i8.p1 TRINITY_DN6661_c0_g1~~TRINITY_DN6661_c0_g1_i8.p1  ORF type:complete len:514 (-),score=94.03 TRINITY_DN6661_c0_g1_i8:1189-2730(-)